MEYKELIIALSNLNNQLKEQSLRVLNTALTLRNWFFGFYIVEFEQHGQDRAQYEKSLLANQKNLKLWRYPIQMKENCADSGNFIWLIHCF